MFISKFLSETMLEAAVDTAGVLETPNVGLMITEPSLSSEIELSDITAATFDDYAPVQCANPIGPHSMANGERYVSWDDVQFVVGPDLAEPQSITGWYLYSYSDLIAYHVFEEPILVDRPGQVLFVRPEVSIALHGSATGDIDSP